MLLPERPARQGSSTVTFGDATSWQAYLQGIWSLAGLVTLLLSVSLPSLVPPRCDQAVCPRASQHIRSAFLAGIFITCIAIAGIKHIGWLLARQQFDETDPFEERKRTRFFKFYSCVSLCGKILGYTLFSWILVSVGYMSGYSIMTGLIVVCAILFVIGVPFLRDQQPTGSPLTTLAQVMFAAGRNRHVDLPADPTQLYEVSGDNLIAHTDGHRWLDKAAIFIPRPSESAAGTDRHQYFQAERNKWKLCTVTEVEGLKIMLRTIFIQLCCGMTYLMSAQGDTFFLQQAAGMDRNLGSIVDIPPAIMVGVSMMLGSLFIRICVKWLVLEMDC